VVDFTDEWGDFFDEMGAYADTIELKTFGKFITFRKLGTMFISLGAYANKVLIKIDKNDRNKSKIKS